MLIVGYAFGIRSERRLCEEVHLNLAYRWFCRLDLTDAVPDHSTFSKNRHGRFRESDLFRRLFEAVLARCIVEGLVGGESFGAESRRMPAATPRPNTRNGQRKMTPAERPRNTSPRSMTPLSVRPRLSSRRQSRRPIPPHGSPEPTGTDPSSPIVPTTLSIWTTRSSSTSRPPFRSGRPKSVPCETC